MLSERSETNKEGVGHLDEHDYFHITLIRTLQFTVLITSFTHLFQ